MFFLGPVSHQVATDKTWGEYRVLIATGGAPLSPMRATSYDSVDVRGKPSCRVNNLRVFAYGRCNRSTVLFALPGARLQGEHRVGAGRPQCRDEPSQEQVPAGFVAALEVDKPES